MGDTKLLVNNTILHSAYKPPPEVWLIKEHEIMFWRIVLKFCLTVQVGITSCQTMCRCIA
jgi:hypothetical protein